MKQIHINIEPFGIIKMATVQSLIKDSVEKNRVGTRSSIEGEPKTCLKADVKCIRSKPIRDTRLN